MRRHACTHRCWALLLLAAAAALLLTCTPRAAAAAGTRKNKHKNHSNFFHSLIRRLGGNNICQPKAKKRCSKPHEVWFDKAGVDQPPTPNGCGSRDLPVKLAKYGNFTECCNDHDVCYGACDHRTKSDCDETFWECMVAHCHAAYDPPPGLSTAASSTHARGKRMAMHLQRCLGEASLYYSGVVGLACGAYKRAQLRHCACRPKAHVQPEEDEEEGYSSGSDNEDEHDVDYSDWEDEDWSEEEFDEEERVEWEQEMGEMMLEDEEEWSDDEEWWSDDEEWWSDDEEGEELVAVAIE